MFANTPFGSVFFALRAFAGISRDRDRFTPKSWHEASGNSMSFREKCPKCHQSVMDFWHFWDRRVGQESCQEAECRSRPIFAGTLCSRGAPATGCLWSRPSQCLSVPERKKSADCFSFLKNFQQKSFKKRKYKVLEKHKIWKSLDLRIFFLVFRSKKAFVLKN